MSWTHLNDTMPKAAKQHRCILCGLPIEKGQVHVARRGIFDGIMETYRMHLKCQEVTKRWGEEEWESNDEMEFRNDMAERNKECKK